MDYLFIYLFIMEINLIGVKRVVDMGEINELRRGPSTGA